MQEAFESKQATMFVAIDKLFDLHNAMLFESRVIIAFLVYSVAIFIVYMLTSIKHAYNVRHRLYLGNEFRLLPTLFFEAVNFSFVCRFVLNVLDRSKHTLVRINGCREAREADTYR